MMFDSLVLGVMMYVIELMGWKESAEIERIQMVTSAGSVHVRLHRFDKDK